MLANWESPSFWKALARGAGLAGAAIGLIALSGWLLDSAILKSLHPDWVAMKANTALGFFLAGAALWLKGREAEQIASPWLRVVPVLSATVGLLGLLTLLEFILGRDLGIDQWLFQEAPDAIKTLAPGRMAPASALCFLSLGLALMVGGKTARSSRATALLAAITAFTALASGLAYLYDVENRYGLGYGAQMAFHTVLAFLVLAAGVVCLQPQRGVVALLRTQDAGGKIARHLLPTAILLPVLIGWLKLSGDRNGLFEADFGVVLVVLTYILALNLLIAWSARILSQADAERVRAHAAIQEREARLRLLLRTIPDLVWLKDTQGAYLACNSTFERFFGAKEADIIGKTDYDFVDDGLADYFRSSDLAAIAANRPEVNEEWLTFADDGHSALVESTKSPMFDSTGKVLGVLGIARDITARHQAEEEIRAAQAESTRLLKEADQSRLALLSVLEDQRAMQDALRLSESALLEAQRVAKIGNWKWDVATGKHTWSAEIFRIYGRNPALGAADLDEMPHYFTPESWAHLNAAVEKGLRQGIAYECDAEVVRPDGSRRWITVRSEARYDASRTVTALVGTVQDITARKLAEEEVQKLNAELEQRVRARTAELEAANKELESFSYSVSHDLRAPLRAISGFAQILARRHHDSLNEEGRHYLDNVVTASERMGVLIDELLHYSRTGRGGVRLLAVPLAPLVGHLAATFSERLGAAGGRLEIVEPLATPLGDATLIGQILTNLVDNALIYRRPDVALLVTISAQREDGKVAIKVTDNGIGIAAAYHEKIFQVFQRLHSEDEYPGTGIGLAIVYKAVRTMEGEVGVESTPGAGSTFSVRLAAASEERSKS